MAVVKVDSNNAENFEKKDFTPIPKGEYVFEIENDLVVVAAKPPSENKIIKVTLVCQDEGEYKGKKVFDNIVLTKKAEYKLCHLALAAGTQTKEEMQEGVDLELFKGRLVRAEISVQAPRTDPATGQMYNESNKVTRYCFDAEDEVAA